MRLESPVSVLDHWPADEPLVRIDGPALSAVVAPERGGKIISILDARGVEWMATPDREVGIAARSGDDFLSAEMAGWDECAPTIVACTVDQVDLADHGELWTKPFTIDRASVWVDDETLGYRFTRTIESTVEGLVLDYSVTAGAHDVPFLWAGHPQFRAPEGTRILLPTSVKTVVDVIDPELPELSWSAYLGSIDTIETDGYRKVYVHPDETVSSAVLLHPDGAALQLSWSSECRYLGLWYDKFAFRAEPIIAIEPSTAYFDSLATAIENGRVAIIAAGTTLQWSVTVTSLA
ncbi:MAG: hypothetical protein LH471_01210 [Salinibacterium sp.]|nr:hypothetical protein [Salinibacterium sp.]